MNASWRTLGLDTAVMGLGLGVAMSAFTSIVQNQYPVHRLGEVSAGLQFFRIIGSTIGLAVFGTILNNRFTSQLARERAGACRQGALGGEARQRQRPRHVAGAVGDSEDRGQGRAGDRRSGRSARPDRRRTDCG